MDHVDLRCHEVLPKKYLHIYLTPNIEIQFFSYIYNKVIQFHLKLLKRNKGQLAVYLAKLVGVGVATALVCAAASGTSRADENEFLDRFHGMWVGSGSVIQNGEPMRVSCHVAGLPVAHRIHIDGNCNISLFSRSFAAELTYNPTTGFYSGVYTGAKVGPARLSGQRKGSAVYLTVTWPRPVHGDTKATMTIENTGRGVLKVGLSDNAVVGGIMLRSDFIFSQR